MQRIVVCEAAEYLSPELIQGQAVNPRKSTAKKRDLMRRSIEKDGLYKPLPVSKDEDRLIGGHLRLHILRQLIDEGHSLVLPNGKRAPGVPVARATFDSERDVLYRDRDNQHDGTWDFDILASESEALLQSFNEEDLELTGFSKEQLEELNRDFTAVTYEWEQEPEEDIEDEEEEKPKSSRKKTHATAQKAILSFTVPKDQKKVVIESLSHFEGESEGEKLVNMARLIITMNSPDGEQE
jgi:hypothetical protein